MKRPSGTQKESPETPKPNQLDIVKINCRWAQVAGARNNIVRYLDEGSYEEVDWNDYSFNHIGLAVFDAIKLFRKQFTRTETRNIHWGPEEDMDSVLKLEVWVFGEYMKK